MTTSVGQAEATTLRLDVVEAVASFFRDDPARILTVASSLRAPDRSLESTVHGMSMGATLPPGSRIRIELVHRIGYDVGEVIAFLAGSQVVVHRIAYRGRRGRARRYYLTRGDATLVPDPPVDHESILGAVTWIRRQELWMPLGGKLPRALRARVVNALLLLVVAGILHVSPRAAKALVTWIHRLAGSLLRLRGRPQYPPHGSFPTSAS
jgi:hypothetical protein